MEALVFAAPYISLVAFSDAPHGYFEAVLRVENDTQQLFYAWRDPGLDIPSFIAEKYLQQLYWFWTFLLRKYLEGPSLRDLSRSRSRSARRLKMDGGTYPLNR